MLEDPLLEPDQVPIVGSNISRQDPARVDHLERLPGVSVSVGDDLVSQVLVDSCRVGLEDFEFLDSEVVFSEEVDKFRVHFPARGVVEDAEDGVLSFG